MADKLTRDGFYPLGDRHPAHKFPPFVNIELEGSSGKNKKLKAQWDGQPRRCPKKGEWYLSGAIITAYRAPNDLSDEFHIARIVEVEEKKVIQTTVLGEVGNGEI